MFGIIIIKSLEEILFVTTLEFLGYFAYVDDV